MDLYLTEGSRGESTQTMTTSGWDDGVPVLTSSEYITHRPSSPAGSLYEGHTGGYQEYSTPYWDYDTPITDSSYFPQARPPSLSSYSSFTPCAYSSHDSSPAPSVFDLPLSQVQSYTPAGTLQRRTSASSVSSLDSSASYDTIGPNDSASCYVPDDYRGPATHFDDLVDNEGNYQKRKAEDDLRKFYGTLPDTDVWQRNKSQTSLAPSARSSRSSILSRVSSIFSKKGSDGSKSGSDNEEEEEESDKVSIRSRFKSWTASKLSSSRASFQVGTAETGKKKRLVFKPWR